LNELIPFDFEEKAVRVHVIAGEPWWVAADLARALGYSRQQEMARLLDDDEKGTHIVSTPGGDQEMKVISESGMWNASFKSTKPEAVRWRKFATSVIFPTLRKTGHFSMPGHEPPPTMPNETQAVELQARVSVVRTALRLFGTRGARDIWVQIGLPVPIAHSRAVAEDDPLAKEVREWLSGRNEVSCEEVCVGLNIVHDHSIGRRIGALLRMFGWRQTHVARDGHRTFRMFSAPGTPRWDEMGGDHV